MNQNGTFIAAHIFIILPLFGHIYLNIYEISKYTYLHEDKKIKLGILKYLFPTFKKKESKSIFLWQLMTLLIFIMMTVVMIFSLYFSFDTKVIVLITNFCVSIIYTVHTITVKKKYKKK